MAVRFDAASDRLLRTSSLPSYDSNYTILLWTRFASHAGNGTYSTIWTLNRDSADDAIDALFLKGLGASSSRFAIYAQSNSATFVEANEATDRSTATWYCVALVRSAANLRTLYVGSLNSMLASAATLTSSYSGRSAPTRMELGGFGSSNADPYSDAGGRISNVKIWSAALTLDELRAEQHTYRPVRLADLHLWSPLDEGSTGRTRDWGPNGYNWSEGGTLSDEDNVPIARGQSIFVFRYLPSSSGGINANANVALAQSAIWGASASFSALSVGANLISTPSQIFPADPDPGTAYLEGGLAFARSEIMPANLSMSGIFGAAPLFSPSVIFPADADPISLSAQAGLVQSAGIVFDASVSVGGQSIQALLAESSSAVSSAGMQLGSVSLSAEAVFARAVILSALAMPNALEALAFAVSAIGLVSAAQVQVGGQNIEALLISSHSSIVESGVILQELQIGARLVDGHSIVFLARKWVTEGSGTARAFVQAPHVARALYRQDHRCLDSIRLGARAVSRAEPIV